MKVTLAKHVGFCDGVKRSIEMVCDEVKKSSGIVYTDGEVIHNENALRKLARIGVKILQDGQDLCKKKDSVVIRAHGITLARRKELESLGCKLIDATCPRVLKIAGLIGKYARDGYRIVLVGDGAHPEVVGLCGYAPSEEITVLSSLAEVSNLDLPGGKIVVFSQTTFECQLFDEIVGEICRRFGNVLVKNTICQSTTNRQREIASFIESGRDCIVVVGSKFSKNTESLRRMAEAKGCHSLIVENATNLSLSEVEKYGNVGIISGASTDYCDVYGVYKKLLALVSK